MNEGKLAHDGGYRAMLVILAWLCLTSFITAVSVYILFIHVAAII